jgi:hypothetical protein
MNVQKSEHEEEEFVYQATALALVRIDGVFHFLNFFFFFQMPIT